MRKQLLSWRQRWWQSLLGLLVSAGLAACSMPPRKDIPQGGVTESAPMPVPASEAESAPVQASPSVASAGAKMMAPKADARAASTLGTQWGEGRESVTKVVRASRLTPDNPLAVQQLRYSDRESILRAIGKYAERQTNVLLANGDVEMAVVNANAIAFPVYATRGAKDYHVAGRAGERYELVYINRSRRFYEVVATVDGLDVLNGKPGSLRNDGYLLRPGERLVIDGFRKSDREVAAFRFSGKDRAYANNTPAGDARNVGVIGTALFEVRLNERDPDLPPRKPPAEVELKGPDAFPGDGGSYAPPPQYRR